MRIEKEKEMPEWLRYVIAASLVFPVVAWFLLGFGVAKENERIVKVRLGRPYAFKESGWYWIAFLLDKVLRYPTGVQEIQIAQRDAEGKVKYDANGKPIPAGGFITKKTDDIGPLNIGVTVSFRFTYPRNRDELIQCVKLLPDPSDKAALTDLFQEIIMDEVRSVGCQMTYMDLMRDRPDFAQKITKAVRQGGASKLLTETGLQDSAQVVIDHIDIPADALQAIDDEEAERLRAHGVRRKAEGEKDRLRMEGEGYAEAYKAIKAEGREAIELDALYTLRKMAEGNATTIIFPPEGLQKLFGGLFRAGRPQDNPRPRGNQRNQPRAGQSGTR